MCKSTIIKQSLKATMCSSQQTVPMYVYYILSISDMSNPVNKQVFFHLDC